MASALRFDIGVVAGDVGQLQQLREAAYDVPFVLLAIFTYRFANRLRRIFLRRPDSHRKAQKPRNDCPSILFQHGCNDKCRKMIKEARSNMWQLASQIWFVSGHGALAVP